MINITYYKSPVGELILGSYRDQICLCDWRYRTMRAAIDERLKRGLNASYVEQQTDLLTIAATQLDDYFAGTRQLFELPMLMVGTEFQKAVWNALIDVKYGTTESYLGIAMKIGNHKAVRAVATANGANAMAIIVPCHRIIGSNGHLTGYAGGLNTKAKLLELESPSRLFR